MRVRLNVRFLAYLLGAVVVLTGGAYFLHADQVKKNTRAFLAQADREEEHGRPNRAVDYLARYLALAPRDTDTLTRYGRLLNRVSSPPNTRGRLRAFLALEQVVRRVPERTDVRRDLVQIAMAPDLGRFADARHHLDVLLRETPKDAELELLLARCLEAGGATAKAVAQYRAALEHAPTQIDGYVRLAHILRHRLGRHREADDVMDDLVSVNRKHKASPALLTRAYLAHARYLKETGRPELAAQAVASARKLTSDDPDVLVEAAGLARERADLDRARTELQAGIEKYARVANLYLALAEVHLRSNDRKEAIACLRRGLKALPGHGELQWSLADLLLRGGDTDETGQIVARLRRRGFTPVLLQYLSARMALVQKQWLRAADALERVQGRLTPWPELSRECNLFLGSCWEQLGDPERQLTAYRRVVAANDLSVPGCLGLGAALAALGKTDEALQVYRRILPRQPAVAIIIARLSILQNLSLPPDRRDWKIIDDLLQRAGQALPNASAVPILRAEALAAQGKLDRAVREIQDACAQRPREVDLWIALASLADRRGKPADALAVLDRAARTLTGERALRIARLKYLAKLGLKELNKAHVEIERDLGTLPADDQRPLLRGLAEAYLEAGDVAESRRLWDRLGNLRPDDLRIKLVRFDLALHAGDTTVSRRVIAEMEQVEGPEGILWRYARVRQCLWRARRGEKSALDEARPLLAALAVRRPGWARLTVCEGEYNDLAGNSAAALTAYQRAIDLGERDPRIILRAAALLSARARYAEADTVIRKLPEEARTLGSLGRLAAQVSLQIASSSEDSARALEQARRAVAPDSKDFRDHVWLGQLLFAAGRGQEAETALRRAVQLADNRPEAWIALVRCLAWLGQKEKAEEAIRQAEQKLPRDRGRLALAHCYEAVGKPERAEKLYRAALADDPDDLATLSNLANFYLLRGQVEAAETHLRRIIRLKAHAPAEAANARRALALALTAKDDPRLAHRALVLLGILDDEGQLRPPPADQSADDLRARAVLLARSRSLRLRRQAVQLVDKLGRQEFSSEEGQLLLAGLYESVGDWQKARQTLLSLATDHGKVPAHLARFSRALLRHGELAQASVWVQRLDETAPKSLETLELKARVLAAGGRRAEAVRLVQGYAESKEARLDMAAGLLEEIGATAEAGTTYEKLVAGSKNPQSVLLQARFLGRRGQTNQALDLCAKAWTVCPAESVSAACVAILYAAKSPEENAKRVGPWLEDAVRKTPASVPLKVDLAALRNLQGRFDEAVVLYREILQRAPESVPALNNLAYLLALRGGGAEALTLIDKALSVEGSSASLLDTRALVHLSRGKPEQAIKDLEEAMVEAPSATRYFHLARAYQMTKDRVALARALRKARGLGLQSAQLHILERKDWEKLLADLRPR